MSRLAPLPSGLAALLAALVLVCAAGPTAAAVVGALGSGGHCERADQAAPDEPPADVASCCLDAPDRRAGTAIPTPLLAEANVVLTARTPPVATLENAPSAWDTGPPRGPRLHLALSVLLV
ncbi:hypothetical protein BSZ37_07830 [Rubrivirga marina]|uniref:Secreted protein n=1 Tax=Rubrivirga marina TaxID=1196024 RepID=A0A271J0V2_9BACT|nr:hypothetical protein BSZ37_07830 [Rubrivirga marina]